MKHMKGCDSINYNTPFSFENFKVIPPPTYEVSFSEIKISSKALFFSATTVSELSYAQDIAIFFSANDRILVITPSEKSEYTSSFFDPTQTKRNVTLIHEKLTSAIRSIMEWPARKGTYRIPGVRVPNSTQTLLCFDLNHASCAKKTTKKIDPIAFLSACPTLQDLNRPHSNYIPYALPASASIPTDDEKQDSVVTIIDMNAAS